MKTIEKILEDQGHQVTLQLEVEDTRFPEGSTVKCGQDDCKNPALRKRTETLQMVTIDGRVYDPTDLQESASILLSEGLAKRVLEVRKELVICISCLAKSLLGR